MITVGMVDNYVVYLFKNVSFKVKAFRYFVIFCSFKPGKGIGKLGIGKYHLSVWKPDFKALDIDPAQGKRKRVIHNIKSPYWQFKAEIPS